MGDTAALEALLATLQEDPDRFGRLEILGATEAARHPPHAKLDRQANTGALEVKGKSTWGLSVNAKTPGEVM